MTKAILNFAFSVCVVLSFFGLVSYFLLIAKAILPYTLGFVLGCLIVSAFIAWRRSRGH